MLIEGNVNPGIVREYIDELKVMPYINTDLDEVLEKGMISNKLKNGSI
jgi:hypothetical protein